MHFSSRLEGRCTFLVRSRGGIVPFLSGPDDEEMFYVPLL